jgi:hypothetical protein
MAWLDTLLGGPPPARTRSVEALSWLAAAMTLVALVLFALGQSLRLPANFGVEDWLGWRNAETLEAAACFWGRGLSRLPAAAAYLLIDTAVFMPLYGLTLLWATRQVRGTMDARPALPWLIDGLQGLAVLSLLLLWVADALENLGGLVRLGIAWTWGLAALVLAVSGYLLLRRWAVAAQRRAALAALAWLVLSPGLMVAASLWLAGAAPGEAELRWIADSTLFGGKAHTAKQGLAVVALLSLLGLWLSWWFGLDLDSRPSLSPQARTRAETRSACRQSAMGVVGRSRYVLAVLVLFAAFTLVLDQCRDVLLALALPENDAGVAWWLIVPTSALGLAMLSYGCWLWARLAGRIKRSGYEVSGLDGVASWAGEWARTWARMLMLAPLLMAALLIANVAGDAVIAASISHTPQELFPALLRLAIFTIIIVALAAWLMRQRRARPLPRVADYYNSVRAVRPLLHDPAYLEPPLGAPEAPPAQPDNILHRLGRPVWQPLLALGLLMAVRAGTLLVPESTGGAPPALAVLALSLVWWLGPLGLIAMSEQRAVFPWGLLLLIVAGVVGLVSDNHTLPALVIDNADNVLSTLTGLRHAALAGLLLLALASAAVWLLLVQRSPDLLRWLHASAGARPVHDVADRWRIGLSAAAVAALCLGLFGVDRWAAGAMPPRQNSAAAPAAAGPMAPGPLLIVASEGGGVRAAYWTARVLAGMQDADPGWASRVVAMSGVSGGSMGIAVWRACTRGDRGTKGTMTDCVEQRFRDLDALTPLLGGLLFEDVWMRLLPTDWLCNPAGGCGMRSRAMGFEREWMRAFPHLAAPLGHALPGEPQLLFNSTVVESGNRAVLGTPDLRPGDLPGAEDLIGSGRVAAAPALVTAAHTSARFPFINPLASLPHDGSGLASAHLADGGYHDNSGTTSLADLLSRWQKIDPSRRLQLVLIRNGQVPASCLPQALAETGSEPPADCLAARSDARELLPPRDARRLGLYADLFGPAVAAINNLGTAAHGREPAAALAARLSGSDLPPDLGCQASSPVCLLDQMQDGSLVPLGWTLSPAARAAMNAQATKLTEPLKQRRE